MNFATVAASSTRHQAIRGDIVSANAAANACAQGGCWHSAWGLFQEACHRSIEADQGLAIWHHAGKKHETAEWKAFSHIFPI